MPYKSHIDDYLQKHGFEALRPKAVLFDMDGVLYDSMPNHAVAWQRAMARYGIAMTAEDAYLTEGQRGVDTIRQMVQTQQGRVISEQEAQLMYDEKTYQFHILPEARVMPGIPELMAQMARDGIAIGVVTGSGQRPLINRLLKDFGQYLDERHIVTAYDVTRGKPNPDPYLMGLEKMGNTVLPLPRPLSPCEAIVIENAPLGVRAGVAAGIFTIAVNTGTLPDEALLSAGANLLFPSMPALSDCWTKLASSW